MQPPWSKGGVVALAPRQRAAAARGARSRRLRRPKPRCERGRMPRPTPASSSLARLGPLSQESAAAVGAWAHWCGRTAAAAGLWQSPPLRPPVRLSPPLRPRQRLSALGAVPLCVAARAPGEQLAASRGPVHGLPSFPPSARPACQTWPRVSVRTGVPRRCPSQPTTGSGLRPEHCLSSARGRRPVFFCFALKIGSIQSERFPLPLFSRFSSIACWKSATAASEAADGVRNPSSFFLASPPFGRYDSRGLPGPLL